MALAWLLTLPSAAIVGALSAWVARKGTLGTVLVALVALAAAARACPVDVLGGMR
jgi:inorganic phosphate transporter, PiT family